VDALHADDALGKSVLESLDERLLGLREEWMYHLFVPGHTPATAYLQRLTELIFSIAMAASCIVPREWRLAVLVVRGFESRVARFAQEFGLESAAARRELMRLQRSRAAFVSRGFHQDVDDPASHDLCIDLDRVPADMAVAILVRALETRFPDVPIVRPA
jgi:hypothetical protein